MSFHNAIVDENDDKLGFKDLAEKIAYSILNKHLDTSNSFTVSVEGKWGSGKTSLVNLVKKNIKDKAVVINFNPWIVSNFEQLIEYFFSELMQEIIYVSDDAKLKEDFPNDIKKIISFFAPDRLDIGIKGAKVTYKPRERLNKKRSLVKTKEKINNYLKNLDKRVIIIIDDIDRLTDKETEALFRLIKAIADFDNIVYILLYDKAVVAKSLEKFKQENGEKYLDKIVQYSITVPKIHYYKIVEILDSELNELYEEYKEYINIDKFNSIISLLEKYISNIRDINKVVSSIKFEYPIIAKEVDFTDFFILTLIKIQKYDLYELIKNREFDYNSYLIYMDEEEFKKKQKEHIENILKPYEKYKSLFYQLFPTLDSSLSNIDYGIDNESIHRYKYIDCGDYFENYFTFSVSKYRLNEEDYQHIYNLLISDDNQNFKSYILRLHSKKIEHFLRTFAHRDLIYINDLEKSKNVIVNLLLVGLQLRIDFKLYGSYIRICLRILSNNKENKEELLKEIYNNRDINLIERVFFYEEVKKDNYDIRIDEETLNKIKELLKQEVEEIELKYYLETGKNENSDIKNIYTLISSYKVLGISKEELMKEIYDLMYKSRENFFKVMNMFVSTMTMSNFDNTNKYTYKQISIRSLRKYTNLDIDKIEEYFNNLDKDSFNDKEKEIYKAWEKRNDM